MDRIARLKWFIILNGIGISVATALNALAFAFWGILYPRCLLALFSAGLDPASMKLISLNFTPETRGVAYGCYLSTVYVGSALASLCLILSAGIGWKLTFLIAGIVGLAAALIAILGIRYTQHIRENSLIKEYKQITNLTQTTEKTENIQNKSDWAQLVKNKTLILTLIATFCRYSAGFSRGYYEALYFSAQFPNEKSHYSIINAMALMITPFMLAAAGKFTDLKEAEHQPKWRAILCCVTNISAVPLLILMYITESFPVAMTCLVIVYTIGETYISISIAMMMNVTLPNLRGLRKF